MDKRDHMTPIEQAKHMVDNIGICRRPGYNCYDEYCIFKVSGACPDGGDGKRLVQAVDMLTADRGFCKSIW